MQTQASIKFTPLSIWYIINLDLLDFIQRVTSILVLDYRIIREYVTTKRN